MNTAFDNLNRLHDLAHDQAATLRREAMHHLLRGVYGLLVRHVNRLPHHAQRPTPPVSAYHASALALTAGV